MKICNSPFLSFREKLKRGKGLGDEDEEEEDGGRKFLLLLLEQSIGKSLEHLRFSKQEIMMLEYRDKLCRERETKPTTVSDKKGKREAGKTGRGRSAVSESGGPKGNNPQIYHIANKAQAGAPIPAHMSSLLAHVPRSANRPDPAAPVRKPKISADDIGKMLQGTTIAGLMEVRFMFLRFVCFILSPTLFVSYIPLFYLTPERAWHQSKCARRRV